MANKTSSNPVFVNSVGGLYNRDTVTFVSGVIVVASGDNWELKLTDVNDNIVFHASSAIANHRSVYFAPCVPFRVTGMKVATATQIQSGLIYTVPS